MAKEKNGPGKGKPQTSAEVERTYTNAMDKIRDEMASSKGSQIQLLGEGLTAMLQLHPELEDKILAKDKTVKGALAAVRQNVTGGCSDPIQTTKSLCQYYGIECANPHVLAMEVNVAMMGGETETTAEKATSSVSPSASHLPLKGKAEADPFDLDALIGAL